MELIISDALGSTVKYGKNPKIKDCTRKVYADNTLPLQSGDHKYGEIITFNSLENDKYAIAIGINPAKGELIFFDKTNFNVAKEIKGIGTYRGYYLLNLYSILQSDTQKLGTYIKNNPDDVINNMQDTILKRLLDSDEDIFIFWGPKAVERKLITNPYLLKTIELLLSAKRNIFYSADVNGNFIHPSNKGFNTFLKLNNISSIL